MSEPKVNDYRFAKMLDQFKKDELDYLKGSFDEAFKIVTDVTYKWKDDKQRETAFDKFQSMKKRYEFFKEFYAEGKRLVKQHEEMTDSFASIYQTWYNKIAYKGNQPKEMMEAQRDMLQDIFRSIHIIIEPLGLNLNKPQ